MKTVLSRFGAVPLPMVVGLHKVEATRALPPSESMCRLTQDQLIDTCGSDGVLNAQ